MSSFEAKMAMKALDKDSDGKLSQDETYQVFSYFTNNFKSITGKEKWSFCCNFIILAIIHIVLNTFYSALIYKKKIRSNYILVISSN